MRLSLVALITATIIVPSIADQKFRVRSKSLQTHEISPEKELVIVSPTVVDSDEAQYPGRLSFGYLMEQAFGKEKAPQVVSDWLQSWETDYKIAGKVVKARPAVRKLIIDPWQKKDGFEPSSENIWEPNFANAPVQLLSVVNRMDMGVNPLRVPLTENVPITPEQSAATARLIANSRDIEPGFYYPDELPSQDSPFSGNPFPSTNVYYSTMNGLDSRGGEGRLIFALLDEKGESLGEGFTLILEYGLSLESGRESLYQWARDWHSLGKHAEMNDDYVEALVKVTDKFTRRKEIKNGKSVDGLSVSQLLRIRTNDGALGKEREFRECRLTSANRLVPATLAGTPADEFFVERTKENRALSRWLKKRDIQTTTAINNLLDPDSRAIIREEGAMTNIALPEKVGMTGSSYTIATGSSIVAGNDKTHHWDGRSVSEEIRRNLSLQSCAGCHCGETGTAYFHIAPRKKGEAAPLSEFLNINGQELVQRSPAGAKRHRYEEVQDRILCLEAYLNPDLKSKDFKKLLEKRAGRAH